MICALIIELFGVGSLNYSIRRLGRFLLYGVGFNHMIVCTVGTKAGREVPFTWLVNIKLPEFLFSPPLEGPNG